MFLSRLSVLNFKNHEDSSLSLSHNINCFVGDNGSGKTNLLDAIHYLSFTKSYFNSQDALNIKHEEPFLSIEGRFEKDGKEIKGVRLNVRGNGETYHIFIRTKETQSYRDYYSASFKANPEWEVIDLPFSAFKHRYSSNSVLEGKNIRTFGIVAYGRDFTSDVSVSTINFYY